MQCSRLVGSKSNYRCTHEAVEGFKHCARCREKDHRRKARRYEANYKFSPKQQEEILKAQGGRCANPLCGATEPGGNGTWKTDHDHNCCPGKKTCGKCFRGLLCFNCNVVLGLVKDSITRLQGLIHYVQSCKDSTCLADL